jgi:antitoxin (DNA-binding transcriptional repressor) of toxin-antitoxin stability system
VKLEISAIDARRRVSEILDRVKYRNDIFVVKRRGMPICEIVPVRTATFTGRDLVELIRSLPHPDKNYLNAVERHVRKQPRVEKSRWRVRDV